MAKRTATKRPKPRPQRKSRSRQADQQALPTKSPEEKRRARAIFRALAKRYPDAKCELDYTNPHELLVATILSAQSTDVGVNRATPALFKRFPTPADYAASSPEEIESYIKTIGLFRSKARAIHETMTTIENEFGGRVPDNMEDLLKLRGVARKTANVVLGNAFGKSEGVVVDTHVARLAHRFGLSSETDPKKIERDLMALFPRKDWTLLSHLLIFHGRRACRARGDECDRDPICIAYCSNAAGASGGSDE